MRIGIATDHGGFTLKQNLVERLQAAGHAIVDFGADAMNSTDDYPDYVVPLARAVVAGTVDRGVAVCGSGRIIRNVLVWSFSVAQRTNSN